MTTNNPTKFCHACGETIDLRAVVCPKCGVPQNNAGRKSRATAAILALVIGGLGAHKFYLGSWGLGILYLVFCWTGIPLVVSLIEGVIYLTKSDAEFAAKYG